MLKSRLLYCRRLQLLSWKASLSQEDELREKKTVLSGRGSYLLVVWSTFKAVLLIISLDIKSWFRLKLKIKTKCFFASFAHWQFRKLLFADKVFSGWDGHKSNCHSGWRSLLYQILFFELNTSPIIEKFRLFLQDRSLPRFLQWWLFAIRPIVRSASRSRRRRRSGIASSQTRESSILNSSFKCKVIII